MPDIQAIDFCYVDTIILLILPHSLVKSPVSLLWVAMVAAAIAARPSVLLYELQRDIEIVRSDILAQDKAVAITEQDHSPDNIKRILFYKHTSQQKRKLTRNL